MNSEGTETSSRVVDCAILFESSVNSEGTETLTHFPTCKQGLRVV